MTNEEKRNIYNNIQNLYNMDFKTWQEVLAMLYNLVADVEQKFEAFEQKFEMMLGKEVTEAIRELYESGKLTEIINEEIFTVLNNKIDKIEAEILMTLTDEVGKVNNEIESINEELIAIETKVKTLEKEFNIGCVLRPTTDINNPWVLYEDTAHESIGIKNITYNSDGTIQLNFDKAYNKIRTFDVYSDEMMKIYGLEVGAKVGLDNAKLFLISNLVFGFTISFSTTDGISCNSGFVESCEWIQGVGAKVKFKNVPKQLPNTAQVSTTNSLNLNSTCSITGNREITMQFYRTDGSLITDITGNWNTMVDVNYRGLVNFNAVTVYDENILPSMAILFNAKMKK